MKTEIKNYWNDVHQKYISKYDNWLDKYTDSFKKNSNILEVGCGRAYSSLYLFEQGFTNITASDISDSVLNIVKEENSKIKTIIIDLEEKFPYDNCSVDIIIADLCLHYFNVETSRKIVNECYRILSDDGYLIARVNSTEDKLHIPENSIELEKNYFFDGKIYKKFFSKDELVELFSDFDILNIDLYDMNRYEKVKKVYEICVKK